MSSSEVISKELEVCIDKIFQGFSFRDINYWKEFKDERKKLIELFRKYIDARIDESNQRIGKGF